MGRCSTEVALAILTQKDLGSNLGTPDFLTIEILSVAQKNAALISGRQIVGTD